MLRRAEGERGPILRSAIATARLSMSTEDRPGAGVAEEEAEDAMKALEWLESSVMDLVVLTDTLNRETLALITVELTQKIGEMKSKKS